ncbi:MAG: OsmC family protein [Ilumatobacter sp.]
MTITDTPIDNGVNVEALLGAKGALTETPAAAAFTWRARCEWIRGTHARTEVQDFSGLGQDHERSGHAIETDHPEIFASENNGMTPPETVLAGLAGCLTAGVASVATHRGIQLHSVSASIEGDMDLQGILGIDPDVRNGFGRITVRFDIDADATDAEIAALVAQSQKRSAVYDLITNPTTVVVSA